MKFDVRCDRGLIGAAGNSLRYVLVSLVAPAAPPKANRKPINVSFVLDRSGSMAGERKIELVKEAVDKAIGMLRKDDRFSLVIYDDKIDVLMESTSASNEAKKAAKKQLDRVSARGNTDLCGGWLRGCEQAAMHLDDGGSAKCLLLTDGLANHGITDRAELARHAGELRQRGILTSTFGVGSDFDEVLLQNMADAGDGNAYYVEQAVQIPDFLTSELGETLEVSVRDTTLQFRLPAGVKAQPLNPYRFKQSGESLLVDLGNLVSEQELTVVAELLFPAGNIGETLSVDVSLTDREGVIDAGHVDVSWTFADNSANQQQPRDRVVAAAVAELYAARARDEALEYNRGGNFEAARLVIEKTANSILEFAGDDKNLNQIAQELLREAGDYEDRMSALDMKRRSYGSHHASLSKDPMGKSRRSRS
jgi:Ca-activated chloride channel family protein